MDGWELGGVEGHEGLRKGGISDTGVENHFVAPGGACKMFRNKSS